VTGVYRHFKRKTLPFARGGEAFYLYETLFRVRRVSRAMKIYLAGPLGFSEAGRHFHNRVLIPALRKLGHEILDPWTLTDPVKIQTAVGRPYGRAKRNAWRKLNVEIGANNKSAIDASDAIFAVLDGVDVDSGTASEIGYGFAVGKPILGYRGDFRLSADNEGSTVNLQVEFFIRQSGGDIIGRVEEIPKALNRIRRT
jgi:nucleoside 2-deoxyribosyltransferase